MDPFDPFEPKGSRKAISQQADNAVLGLLAPRFNPSEKKHSPGKPRTTLSQLRSGYSSSLNSFLHRINPLEYDNTCPECGQGPHGTPHLFSCPAKPTEMDPRILWEDPRPSCGWVPGSQHWTEDGNPDDND